MFKPFAIKADQSRCVRHRYNKSGCERCTKSCIRGGIIFDAGLVLDDKLCTGCMLCVAACPNEAIMAEGYSFNRTLSELSKADRPMLSCSIKDGLLSHATAPCLGFLSAEHLTAMPVLLEKPVQLNLTGCGSCDNGHITKALAERVAETGAEGVLLVQSPDALEYQDVRSSRRDFFRMLRDGSFLAAHELASSVSSGETHASYSRKALPLRRQLLNAAYGKSSGSAKCILDGTYFSASLDEKCNNCFACVAMCPTGALARDGSHLRFETLLCSGCGLCEEFCMLGAVRLRRNEVRIASTGHRIK